MRIETHEMSKLSFRSRTLDAGRPMPIYISEELPDLPEACGINRSVPQMPTGMEKEEETVNEVGCSSHSSHVVFVDSCFGLSTKTLKDLLGFLKNHGKEHDLQQAICTGHIIPTPEVTTVPVSKNSQLNLSPFRIPRQLIRMDPLAMEHDYPDYDMDSEDEEFLKVQGNRLSHGKFEEIMDRLEKSSGQKVVTLQEAKSLLKQEDDLIVTVYDYWLNKRLKTQVPLIPTVKTDCRLGSSNNAYIAFRRRAEKMQTRKNRKNDEASYEKMLKLQRDLSRTVTLLEMVKQREIVKKNLLQTHIDIIDKRYTAGDFNGKLLAAVSTMKVPRPAFAPIFSNQFGLSQQNWGCSASQKVESSVLQKEKRQYKRKKHRSAGCSANSRSRCGSANNRTSRTYDEDGDRPKSVSRADDIEGPFAFRRKTGVRYLPAAPLNSMHYPEDREERFRFYPTALVDPKPRFLGFCRRRIGRGGRMIIDRVVHSGDMKIDPNQIYRPVTPRGLQNLEPDNHPSLLSSLPNTLSVDVECYEGCDSHFLAEKNETNGIGKMKSETRPHKGGKYAPGFDKPNESQGCANNSYNNEVEIPDLPPWTNELLGQPISTTLELYLPEVFSNTPIQLSAPSELEAGDDSFALLEKLGLDDDFIRKEPVGIIDKTPKQTKKVDKNIFDFSETDFLKYETDCDVDDAEPIQQADLVGCSSIFSRTLNSRFNIAPPCYVPLDSEKIKAEQTKASLVVPVEKPQSPKPEIVSIHPVLETVSKKSKPKTKPKTKTATKPSLTTRSSSNLKKETHTNSNRVSTPQAMKEAALNHHNYTITPPATTSKQYSPSANSVVFTGPRTVNMQTSLLARQLNRPQTCKTKASSTPTTTGLAAPTTSTRTVGVTKVKALAGGKVTQKLNTFPSQNLSSESSIAALLREQKVVSSLPSSSKTVNSNHDASPRSSGLERTTSGCLRVPLVVLPRSPASSLSKYSGAQTFQNKHLLSGSHTVTLATLLAGGDRQKSFQDLVSQSQRTSLLHPRPNISKEGSLIKNPPSTTGNSEEGSSRDKKTAPLPMQVS